MRLVFPRRWDKLVDRSFWPKGPWDDDPYDRAQWPDFETKLPCLAIRSPVGAWAGYVGVSDTHPLYDIPIDHGNVTFYGPTDDVHYIEPPEIPVDAHVDENNPLSALDVIRLPPKLWFFGFDAAHHNDLLPMMAIVEQYAKTKTFIEAYGGRMGNPPTYKNLDFIIGECAKLAKFIADTEAELKSAWAQKPTNIG